MAKRLRAWRISFGIRQLLLFVAIVAAILCFWIWLIRWPTITIPGTEIKKSKSNKLSGLNHGEVPLVCMSRFRVNLTGQATITDPWRRQTIVGPGKFALSERQDFYEDTATIQYSPKTATSGSITVRYNFDSG